jgi:hypothetical protein
LISSGIALACINGIYIVSSSLLEKWFLKLSKIELTTVSESGLG